MSYNSDCFDVLLTLMNISSLKEEYVVFILPRYLLFGCALFIAGYVFHSPSSLLSKLSFNTVGHALAM